MLINRFSLLTILVTDTNLDCTETWCLAGSVLNDHGHGGHHRIQIFDEKRKNLLIPNAKEDNESPDQIFSNFVTLPCGAISFSPSECCGAV